MRVAEFFILPTSAEQVIIWKKYIHDTGSNHRETFLLHVNEHRDAVIPVCMEIDGVFYYHIKRHKLYLVAVCHQHASTVYMVELLTRIYHLLKDFCGVVSEASLTENIALVYEILDEIIDSGYVQQTSTEKLKPYIQSEPVLLRKPSDLSPSVFGVGHCVATSDASNRPVITSRRQQELRKNEVFVDVIEKLHVLIAANGDTLQAEVHGRISLKSFLVNSPRLKICLNEEFTVGRSEHVKPYGKAVHLDDCVLHSAVSTAEFETLSSRCLMIFPPEGEFSLMTYTQLSELTHGLPFRIYSTINNTGRDLELDLKLRCEVSGSCHAVNITVNIPVPKSTISFSQRLSGLGQSAELLQNDNSKAVVWRIKRMPADSELMATFKIISNHERSLVPRLEMGPIALSFEISGHVCSGLQIRSLCVCDEQKSYTPIKWIRYITTSDSYVVKL